MTALKAEIFGLIEEVPEENLEKVLNFLKKILKSNETLEEKNLKWLAEPDKYADEINECISEVIQEVRKENAHSN